jgi:hypothetical protein
VLNLWILFVECRLNTVIIVFHFKKGRTSVCDEARSGRLSTLRTENNIEAVERMVREKRRITVDDIAEASICLAQ